MVFSFPLIQSSTSILFRPPFLNDNLTKPAVGRKLTVAV
jgi:hypothetical protein